MSPEELKKLVEKGLAKELPTYLFVHKLYVEDENLDPRHLPAYYFLAKSLQPKSLLDTDPKNGVNSAVFLQGCQVEKFAVTTLNRLGKRNLRTVYNKELVQDGTFDVIFASGNLLSWCGKLNSGGYLIIDYVRKHETANQAYIELCKNFGQKPVIIGSKFGLGVIRKPTNV